MASTHRRARKLENDGAKALGTSRVRFRRRYQKAPDMLPATLPCGIVVQGEAKSRKQLPKLVTEAIAQARRYTPDAVPLAILRQVRGEALVALPLADFVRIAGLEPVEAPAQGSLLAEMAKGGER